MLLGLEIIITILSCTCICKCFHTNCFGCCYNIDDNASYPGYDDYDDYTEEKIEEKIEDIEIILITEQNLIDIEKKTKEESCSICLCEYIPGEHISITKCGHSFHSGCLTEWFMNKLICPMCNTNISTNLIDVPPPYHQDDEILQY